MTEPRRRQVPVDKVRWFDTEPRRVGGAWGAVLAWLPAPAPLVPPPKRAPRRN